MTEKTLCERCGEWVDLHGNHCCDDRQKLIERLRDEHVSASRTEAADHIEELVKEKTALNNLFNTTYNRHVAEIIAVEAKLTKAVEYFKKIDRRGDALETFDPVVHEIVTAALADLGGGK